MALLTRLDKFGVDLNADPVFVPNGFEVVNHIKSDFLEWNPYKPQIELYLAPGQAKGTLDGNKVSDALRAYDGTPANANVLDYLLDNLAKKPWIIPEEWKTVDHHKSKHILFWGTRYRYEDGICVRTLSWSADARSQVWRQGYCWVDNLLNPQFPAAMIRRKKPAKQG